MDGDVDIFTGPDEDFGTGDGATKFELLATAAATCGNVTGATGWAVKEWPPCNDVMGVVRAVVMTAILIRPMSFGLMPNSQAGRTFSS